MPGTNKWNHLDGLVQERRNSSALAMELRLSCANPSIPLCPSGERCPVASMYLLYQGVQEA